MMKLVLVGAASAALVLKPNSFIQSEVHLHRLNDAARAAVEARAAEKGMTYDDFDGDDDGDDMMYGEGALEHELIDENPVIGSHQFTELRDADPADPEPYEGEDVEQIDADDEATNFGEYDAEEYTDN